MTDPKAIKFIVQPGIRCLLGERCSRRAMARLGAGGSSSSREREASYVLM